MQMIIWGGGIYKCRIQAEDETTVPFTSVTSINVFGFHNSTVRVIIPNSQVGKQRFKEEKWCF